MTCAGIGCGRATRILELLPRQGIRYPGPGKNWTQRHHEWLTRLRFEDRAAALTLADCLTAPQSIDQRATALEATIAQMAMSGERGQAIAHLRCFRGVDAHGRRPLRGDR